MLKYLTTNLLCFQNDEELRNSNEPLYYAAQILNGDIKDLTYEVPKPMVEVVEQVLDYIIQMRGIYYN